MRAQLSMNILESTSKITLLVAFLLVNSGKYANAQLTSLPGGGLGLGGGITTGVTAASTGGSSDCAAGQFLHFELVTGQVRKFFG